MILEFIIRYFKIEAIVTKEFGVVYLSKSLLRYYCDTGLVSDAEEMMQALSDRIRNSKLSFDVGANTGVTTLWLSQFSESVHAFEPERSNMQMLQKNMSLNSIQNVTQVACAVSDFVGSSNLHILEGYGHHSLGDVTTSPQLNTVSVPVDTLDNYCKLKKITHIDVLKVDVEGYELEVLQGANELLKRKKIGLVIFEVSEPILEQLEKDKQELFTLLAENGYSIYNIKHKRMTRKKFQAVRQEDLYAIPS